ncbi:SDR family oxidoreductase [Candidatus Omnitrophota bacterium]
MARYLVTGGAGFIGSHIVERLLKEGHFVRVLDNFSSGKRENLTFANNVGTVPANGYSDDDKGTVPEGRQFQLIEGDIRDFNTCLHACEGIDLVLHQAALRSVPKSMKDPYKYNEVNINGTLNMLEASKKKEIKRFVFASSSSVYGNTDIFPQKETHLPKLISPYALTKLAGEYYCRIFSENFGLETVSLRYFNVFGPRQSLDDEYAVVIPKFINCILKDEQPPVFGNGRQSRDFTYIENVVEANILAATVPGVSGQVFNIANGKDNTILELVNILNKILNKSIEPEFLPVRQGDVFRTFADISKTNELLGYKPKTSFEQGLRKTVEYFTVKQQAAAAGIAIK